MLEDQQVVLEDQEKQRDDDMDYGNEILKNARKKRKFAIANYINLKEIPITSNIVERFFSQVKLNLNTLRNRLQPSTLGNIMYLKCNTHLWDKFTV